MKESSGDSSRRGQLRDALTNEQARFEQIQDQGKQALERIATEWDGLQEISEKREWTEEQRRLLSGMKKIVSRRAYLDRVLNDIQTGIETLEKGS